MGTLDHLKVESTMANLMAKALLVVSVAVLMDVAMSDPEPEPGKPKGVSYGGYAPAPVYHKPAPVYHKPAPVVYRRPVVYKAPKYKAPKAPKYKAPKAPKIKVVKVARPVYRPAPVYHSGYGRW